MEALQWRHDVCVGLPPNGDVGWYLADSADGQAVKLGPATYPISPEQRSDIFDRTRVCVTYPRIEVHRLAIYQAMTGRSLGDPRAAGVGTAVSRFHWTREPRAKPYSVVFAPARPGSLFSIISNANPAAFRGVHPGYANPLFVNVGDSSGQLVDLLGRATILPGTDELADLYRRQVEDRLRFDGTLLDSRAYSSYAASLASVHGAVDLAPWFDGGKLNVQPASVCAALPDHDPENGVVSADATRASIRLAAHLLGSGEIEHARVFDRGVRGTNGGAPYDTHASGDLDRHVVATNADLFNLLDVLAEVIAPPGQSKAAGTGALDRISLDDTLIVVQSEFGRTPKPGGDTSVGRDHHGESGCAVLIGGPVANRGIRGFIDEVEANSASAPDPENGSVSAAELWPLKPVDVHCGLLQAAGIDCLDSDNFNASELGPAVKDDVPDVYAGIRQRIFGLL